MRNVLPTPTFIKSAASPAHFPPDVGREVAFVGRSNSGKSTALNLLAGVRKLARVSKTPGRTQLVNFFATGEERRLVDLPGYGFAKVSKSIRAQWGPLIESYLTDRAPLLGVVLLVESRVVTDQDRQTIAWLRSIGRNPLVVATKADKLKPAAAPAPKPEPKPKKPEFASTAEEARAFVNQPLTDEEYERALKALDAIEAFNREFLARRDGKGEILFGGGHEYHDMQVTVTYEHRLDEWKGGNPAIGGANLTRVRGKLPGKETVSIALLGDSISTGCNASGWARST